MYKRGITQLAICELEKDEERISLKYLRKLYLEKTSDIVYITKEGKLYGIVCLSDILYNCHGSEVILNKSFTALTGYNSIKANRIFRAKRNVNKIPVVNEQGELLGDYSRWSDLFYIEQNQKFITTIGKDVINTFNSYAKIYVIQPIEETKSSYECLLDFLKSSQIEYGILDKEMIGSKLSEECLVIFSHSDEQRGMQCLYGIDCNENGVITNNSQCRARFVTYVHLMNQIILDKARQRIDEKATSLCAKLKEKGIKCYAVYQDFDRKTEYIERFRREIEEREKNHPRSLKEPWPRREENEEYFKKFYGELGDIEDYEKGEAQREVFNASFTYRYKDISGKYFNSKNGQRVTCFQPEEYVGTIYLLGKCAVLGIYEEDQFTIGSCLQKRLLEQGYKYRVENYGSILRYDGEIDSNIQRIKQFHANDIVIIAMDMKVCGITSITFEEIFEEHRISSDWVIDGEVHCNHECNKLIAANILEMITPSLVKREEEYGIEKNVQIDFDSVMKKYVQLKYLDKYFENFSGSKYRTIGAFVMNGSLFTKSHRYLVEQANRQVDFLIIFVIEQSTSPFSFEDRFGMIIEGTKDLSHIMVVPNGDFIFSRNTFPEFYGGRRDNGRAKMNAEYDAAVFAEYIAKPLHITHRFMKEESKDGIMGIYQSVMEDFLPRKGITFVRLTGLTIDGEEVSSLKVQRYMQEEEYDKAFRLVTETTQHYLV